MNMSMHIQDTHMSLTANRKPARGSGAAGGAGAGAGGKSSSHSTLPCVPDTVAPRCVARLLARLATSKRAAAKAAPPSAITRAATATPLPPRPRACTTGDAGAAVSVLCVAGVCSTLRGEEGSVIQAVLSKGVQRDANEALVG
jgi:hypothetical protein